MDINNLQKNWNELGKLDPFWAILSDPEKKGNKWQVEEFFTHGKAEINDLIKYLNSLNLKYSTAQALDFGCGAGRLTQALAEYFDEIHGVDISPSMVELANRYNSYGSKCQYHLNQIDNLHLFESNTFNFIYSNITLQHMEPKYSKKYIQEFLRVLAPQGVVIFQLPTPPKSKLELAAKLREMSKTVLPKPLLNVYRKFKYGTSATIEMYGINRDEIRNLVELEGGKIIDIQSTENEELTSYRYCVLKEA